MHKGLKDSFLISSLFSFLNDAPVFSLACVCVFFALFCPSLSISRFDWVDTGSFCLFLLSNVLLFLLVSRFAPFSAIPLYFAGSLLNVRYYFLWLTY